MTTAARRGSILLMCMAIIAALAIIAYGFVRVVQLHGDANGAANRQLLAREAAKMGVDHALEEIVRDYVNEPFTRLDGPAHAAFTSYDQPYSHEGWGAVNRADSCPGGVSIDAKIPGGSLMADIDDVSAENVVNDALKDTWWDGWISPWGAYNSGNTTYDGRGRYIEPGFRNRSGYVAPSGGQPAAPVRPMRFGTALAGGDPLPDLSEGLFLDERFTRITGDPRIARATARYRLRYAVGVVDLDGSILINPDPGLDPSAFTEADPRLAADPLVGRVIRAQHALPTIDWARSRFGYMCIDNANEGSGLVGGMSGGSRLEHIFLGRGYANNFDASPAKNRMPMTWPLMYRQAGAAMNYLDSFTGNSPDGYRSARNLYRDAGASPPVSGLRGGGEALRTGAYPYHLQLNRVLIGPQYSFNNFDYATSAEWGEGYNGWDGTVRSLGAYTPFGRGLLAGAPGRFTGHVPTPWCVNLMTVAPMVSFAQVAAYMPPGAFCIYYRSEDTPAASYYAGLNGSRDLFVAPLSDAFSRYAAPARSAPAIAPDYHVPADRPGDAAYRRPEARYPGILAFNGYGPDMTGAKEWSHDELGRRLRATGAFGAPVKPGLNDGEWPGKVHSAADPYTGISLWQRGSPWKGEWFGGGTNWPSFTIPGTPADPGPPPKAAVPPRDEAVSANWPWAGGIKWSHVTIGTHPDSIWEAIGQAMAATIAVARGQWLDYPTAHADPQTWFNGGPWGNPATRVRSIRDIDALFLANLGHDIANPAGPPPADCAWTSGKRPDGRYCVVPFTPSWNLATLRGLATFDDTDGSKGPQPGTYAVGASIPPYLAAERTQAMELIINDFRLSFFGASPAYGDDFRPLDLNGDGKIACSGYPEAAASGREHDLGISQYKLVAGAGAVDNYFASTGVFFLGKSRYWRVTVRGEVWDNLLRAPLTEAAIDTVLCVDPVDAAQELGPGARNPGGGQYATHVLYQRWLYDKYRGRFPQRY